MIIEGLKLTVLGMAVVFAFLTLLHIVIHLTYLILKNSINNEENFIISKSISARRIIPRIPDSGRASRERRIPVVIAAAIAAYRDKNRVFRT